MSLTASGKTEKVVFNLHYIKLSKSDITTESNSSLYCSQLCSI